ncbi:enoyl-CoA hydratase-related protein [Streptomyces sp. CGMCC 4.7035]|nr:enoyl-CoA hydratase-related protein [Streptomyces sp. CGMCC 4.7035]WNC03159.1 enoyl-CoA hydratase-related protein [Streptomyces sp. CGMCC 4.7035]
MRGRGHRTGRLRGSRPGRPGNGDTPARGGDGLIPGAGGTASLPVRIGRERTAYLALSGVTLTAGEALAWGLVDEITPSARVTARRPD